MKLIILQENLKHGINIVERVTTKLLTLPILNNILIKAKGNFLNLSATDLETGINWWALIKVEKEGEITIPARVFSNFINFLPNKPTSLELKNKELSIKCENYQTHLKGLSSEDFPIIPQINEGETATIENQIFCQGLSQVVDFTAPSTTRPEISGIYFLFEKNLVKMAATDSFRLGEKNLFLEKPLTLAQGYSLILPQKAAKEIINIFGEKEGELKICFSPNQIVFEFPMAEIPHPQIQLVSRLIEGEYPPYQDIIPKKFETQAILSRNEFLNQIKTASLFSGKINELRIKVDPQKNGVDIFSQNPDLGQYHSFLPGKIKGAAVEISFNHRFLVEGLMNIKSSEVIFEINNEGGPGVLKPSSDSSYIYVVMPIKAS